MSPAGLFSDIPPEEVNRPGVGGENRFQVAYREAVDRIKRLHGTEVKSGKNMDQITWTVVDEVDGHSLKLWEDSCVKKVKDPAFYTSSLADSLLLLWPGNIWMQWEYMNKMIREDNRERRKIFARPIKEVSRKELLTFLSLIIAATQYSERGRPLWGNDEEKATKNFSRTANFTQYMSHTRFQQIKSVIPSMMIDDSKKETDDWWKHRRFVDGFNSNREKILHTSRIRVLDETMSALWPR